MLYQRERKKYLYIKIVGHCIIATNQATKLELKTVKTVGKKGPKNNGHK